MGARLKTSVDGNEELGAVVSLCFEDVAVLRWPRRSCVRGRFPRDWFRYIILLRNREIYDCINDLNYHGVAL
jgi:hypothetical protein